MISESATCAWLKPCACPNFFLRLWIELRFCINLAMHMLFDGKLFLSKTNWSIQSIFNFSKKSAHIVHGRRPFKFARCAIVLLFELNGNPSLRVTSEFLWGRFASAKRISDFSVLSGQLVALLSKFRPPPRTLMPRYFASINVYINPRCHGWILL